jgi:acyl transferase domain-containing protein/acyl-CoA synthetase (AMP-forming)/AMP-acid ligase II/NADPH:quinone reductase-like Zn-dependent oxidoreductase/acyl carrier protein/SAM-dependent methyltransferase
MTVTMKPLACHQLITAVVRERALAHGPRTAAIYLSDGEETAHELTYGALDHSARRIGAWLADRLPTGERVLLVLPAGVEVIEAFFGCLYAGMTAVLATPPRRRGNLGHVARIAADSGARFVLSSQELMDVLDVAAGMHPLFGACQWWPVEGILAAADAWHPPEIDPCSLAFLQYTSGSTGAPKGVAVSHRNLIANQQAIQRIFRQEPESMVMAGWLPMYHDMGLVGCMLHPLYLGGTLVFMSPLAFLQRPSRWLRMISRYRATISGGPNFAYELCVSRIPHDERAAFDLRSWTAAFNGAEPVRHETLDRFQDAFAEAGFAPTAFGPCYGMAETTLLVSGSSPGEAWQSLEVDSRALRNHLVIPAEPGCTEITRLVSSGTIDEGYDIRIVAPNTRAPVASGQIGEIWLAGPSVAEGYWGNEPATIERFCARPNDPGDDRTYLRTGDLGAFRGGQLYVTGRLKDVIIIDGVNHYPQDIERAAEDAHPDLASGNSVAFGVPGDDGERVHLACEPTRGAWRTFDFDAIVAAVCQAVWDEHQVAVDGLLLIRPGSVPKTTSGKLQRAATRRMCEEGTLPVLASWERAASLPVAASPATEGCGLASLQSWMQSRISALTGTPSSRIGVCQPFALHGMTSVRMVQLATELGERLQRPVPPTLAYDYPTIEALSRHLVGGGPQSSEQSAADIRPEGDEPIAVIGMACRFPGAESIGAFGKLLRDGRCAIGPMPSDRTVEADQLGQFSSLPCGYLRQIDRFDPLFFSISPREAEDLDPQQRLMLEVTWEAFENHGLSPQRYAEGRTGVFVGSSSVDYARLMAHCGNRGGGHRATGNSMAMIANRVSYLFNLRGPSLSIDTACSSSLVALHYAAESLRRGECDCALAGGVSVMSAPDAAESLQEAGMLSPSGESRAFADGADGFVRGEGCGLVVLKRLSDAKRDGDAIIAVLRGSAVNQDGRSNGLTAPNGLAQQAVIRTALARSGLEPADIDFIEAHGTSTELGDPIEMHALMAVFGPRTEPLRIASVKNNIGHLEGAAGIAGLIKTCIALRDRHIPPHIHWDRPNTHIPWQNWVEIPTRLTPWPVRKDRVRRAGVSSFGFGGTNAHVVVEEPPVVPAPSETGPPVGFCADGAWLKLSARSSAALRELANRYAGELSGGCLAEHPLADVVATANVGREDLPFRAMFCAESQAALVRRLQRFAEADGSVTDACSAGEIARSIDTAEDLAWTWFFADTPWPDASRIAADLAGGCPSFAETWRECMQMVGDRTGPAGDALAVQCALAEWWKRIGLSPGAVCGSGYGQLAAAVAGGVLSVAEAFTLRGLLVATTGSPAGRDEAAYALLEAFVASLVVRETNTPLISPITGMPIPLPKTADEWLRTVAAQSGVLVNALVPGPKVQAGFRPTTALGQASAATTWLVFVAPSAAVPAVGRVVRAVGAGEPVVAGIWSAIALAYCDGFSLDWRQLIGRRPAIDGLPTYPFQRQPYWFRGERPRVSHRPFLGTRIDIADPAIIFETDLSQFRELADHRLHGESILPASAYLDLAVAAARATGHGSVVVDGLKLETALRWNAETSTRMQITVRANEQDGSRPGGSRCDISVRREDGWQRYATCSIATETTTPPRFDVGPDAGNRWCPRGRVIDVATHYSRCSAVGLDYRGAFRCVESLWATDSDAWGEIALSEAAADVVAEHPRYVFHPAILDGCLQVIGAIGGLPPGLWLPVEVSRLSIARPLRTPAVRVHARYTGREGVGRLACDLEIVDGTGAPIAVLEGLRLQQVDQPAASGSAAPAADLHWVERWESRPRVRVSSDPPPVTATALARTLGNHPVPSSIDASARRCLDELSVACAVNALGELAGHSAMGGEIAVDFFFEEAGIAPSKRPLCLRMMQILVDAGYLLPSTRGWMVQRALARQDVLLLGVQSLQSQPDLAPELRLLMRCGTRLSDALRGEADPLPLLFSTNGASAPDVYARSSGAKVLNDLVSRAVVRLVDASPAGRPLRILELGGGTAATTRPILGRVPTSQMRYTFTDIAQVFLAAAAEEFAEVPAVSTKRLDIELDPMQQGFEPGTCDVVIAANVLHATANLEQSIRHVRTLLAPGGQLLLVEGTRPVTWMDLTFGLTDGWWRYRESDPDRSHPFVTQERWRQLLEREGFVDVAVIAPGSDQPDKAENVLLIATYGPDPSPRGVASRRESVVVVATQADAGRCLCTAIADHAATADLLVVPSMPGDDWRGRLAAALTARQPKHVVLVTAAVGPSGRLDERLPDATAHVFDSLRLALQAHLVALSQTTTGDTPALCLVTRGGHQLSGDTVVLPDQSAAHAVLRSMMLEHPECQVRMLDLGVSDPDCWNVAAEEILADDPERDVAFRGSRRFVRRLRPQPVGAAGAANQRLQIVRRGSVDGVEVRTVPREAPGPGEVEIEVRAAGLNFRDVLNVLGRYEGDVPLGAECAGIVTRVGAAVRSCKVGDSVAALAPDSIAAFVTVVESLVVPIPAGIDIRAAASLPVAYLTGALALESFGRIQFGQRVLIHSATGGVGLAALEIARSRGATIFASASRAKHSHLFERGITRVYDSRTPAFAEAILADTAGAGVDLVLNTLDESYTSANLAVIARNGSYIDITKPGGMVAERVKQERPDVRYHAFDLALMARESPDSIQPWLQKVFARIGGGDWSPLPVQCYPLSSFRRALRRMQRAEHVGKLVVAPDPLPEGVARAHGITVRRNGAYVIAGGYGDLGLLTTRLLVREGAGLIALIGRTKPGPRQQAVIDELRDHGARIEVFTADVGNRPQLSEALAAIRERMPIVGVIHAAGVLADALIEEQSPEDSLRVFNPKVCGAWNLHVFTAGDQLDSFVLYSSIASVLGSPGQANHAAANGFLDGLAQHRLAAGLPATCLQWGPWAGIGEASRRGVAARNDLRGIGMLTSETGTEALRLGLHLSGMRLAVVPIALSDLPPRLGESGLFEQVSTPGADGGTRADDLWNELRGLPQSHRMEWAREQVAATLARVLAIEDARGIRPNTPLTDLGLDSLSSIDFIDALNRQWGISWPSSTIYDHTTVAALARRLVQQLDQWQAGDTAGVESASGGGEDAATGGQPVLLEGDVMAAGPRGATGETGEVSAIPGTGLEVHDEVTHLLTELQRWRD